MQEIRRSSTKEVLAVDAGNLLFAHPLSVADRKEKKAALATARGILEAYTIMGYDAVGVSGDDLSAGIHFFGTPAAHSFPFVAANVYDRSGRLLFAPHIIKHLDSRLTLGIIGITGDASTEDQDIIIGDWHKALREQIEKLRKNCAMLIVLSSLSNSENTQLQQDFKQIDILVSADKKRLNLRPQRSQNTLMVNCGSRGKYIGRLDITRYGGGGWIPAAPEQTLQQLMARKDHQPGKVYQSLFLPIPPHAAGNKVDSIVQAISDAQKKQP